MSAGGPSQPPAPRRGDAHRSDGASGPSLWRRLRARAPWLVRLGPWGISLASLALGLCTLFVFRRGLPHVGWIVGYVLLLWLIFLSVAELRSSRARTGAPSAAMRRRREPRGRHLVIGAGEYAIQSLFHGLLLFVLPAYYAAATLTSVNVAFLAAVAGLALLTAVDPWYRSLVGPRAWLGDAFLGFTLFAALNVALALVGIRPVLALLGSAALAALALAPAFRHRGPVGWKGALARAAALAGVAALLAWFGRALVPPAPLFMARAAAAREVIALEPVDVIPGAVAAATVAGWGGLAAFTAIHAPGGIRQEIAHVWRKDGIVLARIPLSPVLGGGRAEGFRTWSRRRYVEAPPPGRYTVDVVTASDQLIGRLAFTIAP